MNITRQRIVTILLLTFTAQMLLGCAGMFTTVPEISPTPGQATLAPSNVESPNPAYALAQATIDAGQSQLLDLSQKATGVSLDMTQAANAAAQSTQDYNQRQKMDLDYQATIVSLNIAQAAATQEVLSQHTKMARNATTAAQSSAAAATHSADLTNATRTAQAQATLDDQATLTAQSAAALTAYPMTATYSAQVILNAQATQAAQANANLTAYPLTATPFAATKAALLMQQYGREQQSFIDRVVKPMVPFVAILVLLLFILVIILAYRQYMSMPWPRRLRLTRGHLTPNPMIMIDGVTADHDPRLHRTLPYELTPANSPRLPGENRAHVEIMNAAEPPVAHWIADVEQQLAGEGGL